MSVLVTKSENEKDVVPVLVRIPADLLKMIDSARQSAMVRKNRTSWILEALLDKAVQENGNGGNGVNGEK